jgi:2-(1,2-epoxy-1,2-dihydrophenyl)acetyl-CoA isomerase
LAVSAPVALAATKALLRKAHHQPFDVQLDAEQESFEQCASTQDFREALDGFFARRPPNFTGK